MSKQPFAIVLIGGAALLVACGAIGGLRLAAAINSAAPQPIPGRFDVSLGPGQWEIYQLTGSRSGSSFGGASVSITNNQPASLTASMVRVTAPGGHQVQ